MIESDGGKSRHRFLWKSCEKHLLKVSCIFWMGTGENMRTINTNDICIMGDRKQSTGQQLKISQPEREREKEITSFRLGGRGRGGS